MKQQMWRALAALGWVVLFMLAGRAQAQGADPNAQWLTADTAHFRVHYRSTQRAQAQAVARAAEGVYPRVTQALEWEPRSRTEVLVLSEFDLANGWSTPLPFNTLGIYITPPDDGELLDSGRWLDLLLLHEFTHTVHLDKVRSAPAVLRSIFGRVLWFMPNLLQPGWPIEGLATWHESDPASGRGRLQGPMFEAWLRAERTRGFLKLAEINADGRALPVSKQYLYGAYFFEFMARRYGKARVYEMVQQYSGNIVPRLHSAPWGATGKSMDLLWDEFLADLDEQVRRRAAPVVAVPEVTGQRLLGPVFEVPSVATLPDGSLLAVIDDGLKAPRLERVGADGSRRVLAPVNFGARLSVAADGRVLLTQPDRCDVRYLAYDVYRLEGEQMDRLVRLTHCAHLRRAVHAGSGIVAVKLDEGATRLVRLAGNGGGDVVTLWQPAAGVEIVDLAASPDGRRLSVAVRDGTPAQPVWRVLALDLTQPSAAPRELIKHDAPLHQLRHGPLGLELVMVVDGEQNAWRLDDLGRLRRLTHAHTAVVAQGGTNAQGVAGLVTVVAQGVELRRRVDTEPVEVRTVNTLGTGRAPGLPVAAATGWAGLAAPAALATAAAQPPAGAAPAEVLGEPQPYAAWRSMAPRSWLPMVVADHGLSSYGASTAGSDAMGWHRYAAYLMRETHQGEWQGGLEYVWRGFHGLALDRSLTARAYTGASNSEQVTQYDRRTQAQWLSLFPVPAMYGLQQRVSVGVGAAMDRVERVDVAAPGSRRFLDERLVAVLADYDSRASNWYADGINRGHKLTLRVESHKPFSADRNDPAPDLDGSVARGDLRSHFGIGSGVVALRWTEARARGTTTAFQLGGASETARAIGFDIGNRDLPLRGYIGNEAALRGANARVLSAEWRMPLVDIDRHGMVPPLGINRLAGTVFFDMGRAWDDSHAGTTRRGVGIELRAETRLLYALALDVRLGVAQALDPLPGGSRTRAYFTLGQGF